MVVWTSPESTNIYLQRIKAEGVCDVAKEMESFFYLELREIGLSHLQNKGWKGEVLLSVCAAGTEDMAYTKNPYAAIMILGIV